MTYQQKIKQIAKQYLVNNPDCRESQQEVEDIIFKNNSNRWVEPCDEFDYSGTIWCDRCGFESQQHIAATI